LNLIRLKKFIFIFFSKKYFTAAFKNRVFPSIEHDFLWTNEYKTIIDIGANKGQFSLAARKNIPDSEIFAFEPLKKPGNIFRLLFSKDKHTHLFNIAIGAKKKESIMNVSRSDDSSSLLEISDLQNDLFPNTYKDGSELIHEDTLESTMQDYVINSPSLLKIDVQGYELEVLKGCMSYMSKFDSVYCECSYMPLYKGQPLATEIISYMESCGFVLDGIYNTAFTKYGKAIQSDILFKKK
jgi:FkbM family methyltransferase